MDATYIGVLGGPPCQGFVWRYNDSKRKWDNKLVLSYARVLRSFQLISCYAKNVPQFDVSSFVNPLKTNCKMSFRVVYGILNAAQYGTPQNRHRLFWCIPWTIQHLPTLADSQHGKLGQLLYAISQKQSWRVALIKYRRTHFWRFILVIAIRKIETTGIVGKAHRFGTIAAQIVTVGRWIHDLDSAAFADEVPQHIPMTLQSDYQRSFVGS